MGRWYLPAYCHWSGHRCKSGRSQERPKANPGWVSSRLPDQMPVDLIADDFASTILVGGEGDQGNHPAWANEGSFMVFRTYEQRVPEFVG